MTSWGVGFQFTGHTAFKKLQAEKKRPGAHQALAAPHPPLGLPAPAGALLDPHHDYRHWHGRGYGYEMPEGLAWWGTAGHGAIANYVHTPWMR